MKMLYTCYIYLTLKIYRAITMITYIHRNQTSLPHRLLTIIVNMAFVSSLVIFPPKVHAQTALNLPAPGTMITPSIGYSPPIMAGMTIHPDNPLKFDFIISTGDDDLEGEAFRRESEKLINYFLATLTVPDDEMWVNLSPYEKDRIIAEGLGATEMGRDMLVQDYVLKQLTASLMYPEDELGDKFWKKVYEKSHAKFGTTEIPANTFNKVWIVPQEAVVYVNGENVFVSESHLNVMLEEDYLALEGNQDNTSHGLEEMTKDDIEVISRDAKEVIREVIIPEIEREVNEGKNFANLRQIYHSMILATWYKRNLKESIIGKLYMDMNKVKGIDLEDKQVREKIYNQYVEAFKKGVYDYIREDYDEVTQEIVPRKYFSGGLTRQESIVEGDLAMTSVIAKSRRGESKVRRVEAETPLADSDGRVIKGEGPAMRWSGQGLKKDQEKVIDDAVREYFTIDAKVSQRTELDVEGAEYKTLDPEGLLAREAKMAIFGMPIKKRQVKMFFLPGLVDRIKELAAERGVDAPDDLVAHPGRTRSQLYLDPNVYSEIASKSEDWRKAWANHELAHIMNPTESEAVVQALAPLPERQAQATYETYVGSFGSLNDAWNRVVDLYGDFSAKWINFIVGMELEQYQKNPVGNQYETRPGDVIVPGMANEIDYGGWTATPVLKDQPHMNLSTYGLPEGTQFKLFVDRLANGWTVAKIVYVKPGESFEEPSTGSDTSIVQLMQRDSIRDRLAEIDGTHPGVELKESPNEGEIQVKLIERDVEFPVSLLVDFTSHDGDVYTADLDTPTSTKSSYNLLSSRGGSSLSARELPPQVKEKFRVPNTEENTREQFVGEFSSVQDAWDRIVEIYHKSGLQYVVALTADRFSSAGFGRQYRFVPGDLIVPGAALPIEHGGWSPMPVTKNRIRMPHEQVAEGSKFNLFIDWTGGGTKVAKVVIVEPGIEFEGKSGMSDQAMLAPGGIDFNPNIMDFREKGQRVEFQFNSVAFQNIQPNTVEGILPVIINITPIVNFVPLLGFAENVKQEQLTSLF